MSSQRRRWLRPALAVTIVIVAWVVLVMLVHGTWVAGLRRPDAPDVVRARPKLPAAVLRKVGFFRNQKDSSFVKFPRRKPEGITRICALGDSFTHGEEVSASLDFPSRLQELLDFEQPGAFEVLNFGQGSFGFHQTYVLWDDISRGYGCDVVLLGPQGFYPHRDTTFNHSGSRNPYYLHARFVLSDGEDDVELVEVLGETTQERFEEYHRLVPHERYRKYDEAPPSAVRAMLGESYTVDNPFYYRDGDTEEEARATYRILLSKLAETAPRVLLGGSLQITSLARDIPKIETIRLALPTFFPYRAPRDHFGPLGNDLVARQFARKLLAGAESWVPGIRVTDLPERPTADQSTPPPSLSEFEAVHARLGARRIGHFVRGATHLLRQGGPGRLRADGVAALLLAGAPLPGSRLKSDGPLDGCFLAFPRPLVDGTPVHLESDEGRQTIGHVRLWDPELAMGDIALEGRDLPRLIMRNAAFGGRFVLPDAADGTASNDGGNVRIVIGNEVVLEGPPSDLRSKANSCWVLRANETGYVDLNRLPPSGIIEIVGGRVGRPPLRVPIAAYERVPVALYR